MKIPHPQKIFGIGLPRTGTTSLDRALDILGYRSAHFPFEFWEENDFSKLVRFDAFTDNPVFDLFEELDQRCPGSKFIWTVRPVDGWLTSMEWLLSEGPNIWPWREAYNEFNASFFGSASFDAALYTAAYHRHAERLEAYFRHRPDDLLRFDVTEGHGWEELCGFLGQTRPAEPFPRGNPARKSSRRLKIAVRLQESHPVLYRIYRKVIPLAPGE